MTETVLKTIFQVRRGTAAEWEASTYILRPGEPAYAIDTGVFKVGTGDKTWNELAASGGPSILDQIDNRIKDLETVTGSGEGAEGAGSLLDRIETLEQELGLSGDTDGTELSVLDRIEKIEKVINTTGEEGVIDTVVDLIDYVNEHGATTDAIIEKLNTIEEGAEVNILEGIKLDGEIVDLVDKIAEIPVAKLEKGGIVKSATGPNKVNVSNNGIMSVNKISTSSLVTPIGTVLVFDGGNANGNEEDYNTVIGNIGYSSITEAIAAADNGDVIAVQNDIAFEDKDDSHLVINAENVTIDLGQSTITANGSNGAIKVESGVTTLEGNGEVKAGLGTDNYSMAIWAEDGQVNINGGTYTNSTDGSERGTDLVYASGNATIEINGGTFIAAKPEWTLNCKDADYKAGTANIIVKGGRFYQFDPANNNTEGAGTNYVAEGYKSVKDGDYYVVSAL